MRGGPVGGGGQPGAIGCLLRVSALDSSQRAGGPAAARSRPQWRRPRLGLGLPLGLGGGGAQTGDRWSCAQHSGCRLYMGRKLEEIRWSPSNGTVQRSNPSNVPQDNRSAHVPLNRRWWGQARRREQWAGRRGESEGEKGAEIERDRERGVCMGWGGERGERGDTERKTERDIQGKRDTHTERGRNRNRGTKIRTKRHKKNRRKRWREVATYTHTPTGGKERSRHTKRKPRSEAKKGKVHDRGRSGGERKESGSEQVGFKHMGTQGRGAKKRV